MDTLRKLGRLSRRVVYSPAFLLLVAFVFLTAEKCPGD